MAAALTLNLAPDKTAPGLARRAARNKFGALLGRQQLDDLTLVISELISNAVVHGRGEIVLRLQLDGETIRGEVIDDGGGFEHEVRARGADNVGGRGLLLVEALTSRWGIHEGTTHVWFETSAGAADRPEHLEPRLGESRRPDALD